MSKEVKRYEHVGDYCGPQCGFDEAADGDWIRASDYEALLAERDAYKKAAERFRWLLRQAWFQSAFDRYDYDDGGMQKRFKLCVAEIIDSALQES